jgi:hypothetical protein
VPASKPGKPGALLHWRTIDLPTSSRRKRNAAVPGYRKTRTTQLMTCHESAHLEACRPMHLRRASILREKVTGVQGTGILVRRRSI